MKDAYRAIGKRKVSTNENFAECLEGIAGYKWRSMLRGDAQKGWNAFQRIETIRHRLFHGYKTVDPALVHAASHFLSRSVPQNDSIFGRIEIEYGNGVKNDLGNALHRYPAAGKKIPIKMDVRDLEELMKIKVSSGPPNAKLPSTKEAQGWGDIFQT
ncbi:MAG: hypothetical protein R6U55_06400 [Desulfovermiculus sp.]